MHRRRGSSGLNWKPHFMREMVDLGPPPCSGVSVVLEGRGDGGSCFVGDFGGDFVGGYAVASWPSFCVRVELASLWWYGGVAVGCFSHVLMISMSSGFALYAAATLLRFVSCMIRCKMMHLSFNSPGICGTKVYSDNDSVRRNLNMFIRISIAIDDRRRS
jgi:hypothetical protein